MHWVANVGKDGAMKHKYAFCSSSTASVEETKGCHRGFIVQCEDVALKTGNIAKRVLLAVTSKIPRLAYVSHKPWNSNDDVLIDLLVDLEANFCWKDEDGRIW